MSTLLELRNLNIAGQNRTQGTPAPSVPSEKEPEIDESAHIPTNVGDNIATNIDGNVGANTDSNIATQQRTQPPTKQHRKVVANTAAKEDWRAEVLAQSKRAGDEGRGERVSRINFETDADLHKRLKSHVLDNDTTLKKLLDSLIAAYLAGGDK